MNRDDMQMIAQEAMTNKMEKNDSDMAKLDAE